MIPLTGRRPIVAEIVDAVDQESGDPRGSRGLDHHKCYQYSDSNSPNVTTDS